MELVEVLMNFMAVHENGLSTIIMYIVLVVYFLPTIIMLPLIFKPFHFISVLFMNVFLGWNPKWWFVALTTALLSYEFKGEPNGNS